MLKLLVEPTSNMLEFRLPHLLNPKGNYEKIVTTHRVPGYRPNIKVLFLINMDKGELNTLCNLCLCVYVSSKHLLKNPDTFKDYEYSLFFTMASLTF